MPNESSSSVRIFYPKYNKEELVRRIKGKLKELNEQLKLSRVVLFGSYAKGNYTAASDVDLLVVYRGEPEEDPFKLVKRTIEISGLEPHIYREEEYVDAREKLEKMEEGGEVLWENPQNQK